MRNRTSHTTCAIAVATAIILLTGLLPLPAYSRSASAKTVAGSPSTSGPTLQGEKAVQHLKQQGLYDSLKEAVAATRYEIRWDDQPAGAEMPAAYHATNPAQRLSAYFTPTELRLVQLKASPAGSDSETPKHSDWQAAMRLVGYGYGDNLVPVAAGELAAQEDRIEIHRSAIVEWYANKAEGLEQGFTIDAAPGPKGDGERLRLTLELTDDLSTEIAEEGRAIALKQVNGNGSLRYGDLYVTDASGRVLPSQMSLRAGRVLLEADDEGAAYPVTIDPTFTQQRELIASDGAALDVFGSSVAVSGDTVVVGAYGDSIGSNNSQGSAYVFVRGDGSWIQSQKLTASDGAADDTFAQSVVINGDTIVVGAYGDDIGSNINQGSAYVFANSAGIWNQQQKLIAADGAADDDFGCSVALSRDTLIVGAYRADIGSKPDQGSAYVFVLSNGSWLQQQKLVAGDGAAGDNFGNEVAISGDTVIVGAHFADIGANFDQGSAYIFSRTGNSWSQQQKLTATDGATDDRFGDSVAISGGTVVVGALYDDIGANSDQGSAYVFVRNGSAWNQQQKLTNRGGGSVFR